MALTKVTNDLLDLGSSTGALALPSGTTAQRPASPILGMLRENTDNSALELYNGTEWGAIGGGSGGGLEGTQYVFVQANGTDVENAIELQAAYDLAITKIGTSEVLSAPYDMPSQQNPTTLHFYDFSMGALPVLIVGQTYTFNVGGDDMVGEVTSADINQYLVSFTAFAYMGGDVYVYISEIIKSIVIAAPGIYNFEDGNFIMDTDYVDLVSLDGNISVVFYGANTIEITANNVFVKGVDTLQKQFKIGYNLNLPKLTLENCTGGDNSFAGGTASGTFINCTGGVLSFGGYAGTASGTFTNCIAGEDSFGGTASGTFTNCTGGNSTFGSGGGGTASGKFTNCIAGQYSFRQTLSGKLYYCRLTAGTFKTVSSGGRTVLCIDGNNNQNNQ